MSNKVFVEIKEVSKDFKKRGFIFDALKSISVTFEETSFIAIVGKSGCGKTTLLNILGGLDFPTKGKMLFCEENIDKNNADQYRSNNVSFVFQDYNLIDNLTIFENLKLSFEFSGIPYDGQKLEEVLKLVGLPDEDEDIKQLLIKKPMELSGGQRQRVAIARSLIKNPAILILDEPTGALDEDNAKTLMGILKELSKHRLVIMSSHNEHIVNAFADRIIRLSKGSIIEDRTVNETVYSQANNAKIIERKTNYLLLLKRAIGNLFHNKIKLTISLILSIVTTSIFGIINSFQATDSEKVALKTQYEAGEKKKYFLSNTFYSDDYMDARPFTDKQKAVIDRYSPKPIYLRSTYIGITNYFGNPKGFVESNPCSEFVVSGVGWAMPLNSITGCDDAGITRDPRLKNETECRLPVGDNEFAISDLLADEMLIRGLNYSYVTLGVHKTANDTFSSLDSIIGYEYKTPNGVPLKIVGIFKTEDDAEKYGSFRSHNMNKKDFDDNERKALSVRSISQLLIIDKNSQELGSENNWVMLNLSGNIEKDLKLRDDLKMTEDHGRFAASIHGQFSGFTEILDLFSGMFSTVVYVLISVFLLISVLVSFNLFYTNIKEMEKEFGILRALGAKKHEIASIVYFQGLFLGIIVFLSSLLLMIAVSALLNAKYRLVLLSIEFLPVLLTLLLCIAPMFIVTYFSSLKSINQKTINVIENK